jgi:hypothetical protein
LGLDYVYEDFLQRGILTDGKDTPSEKASSKAKRKQSKTEKIQKMVES